MSLDGRIRQGLVQAADSIAPNVEGALMKVDTRARNRRRIRWAAGAAAVAAAGAFLFLGGTDLFDTTGDTDPIPPASTDGRATEGPTPHRSPSEPETSATLEVWFTRGEALYSDAYAYEGPPAIARAALERLLMGADLGTGLSTQIPAGSVLLGIDISDEIATVDLSEEFQTGGGGLSMRMRVAQIVYTLTQFDTVAGVLFEIGGEPVDAIGGEGVDVSSPQSREDYEDLLAPITVTRPGIGWDFASGDTIEGTANVFEANVSWRILDGSGDEIASGFTTATCGSGCRGDFSTEAEFGIDANQEGTIEVLEYSAESGEPINVVSIPVTLLSD